MQDSCWLPLLPLAVPHLAASFDLPSSCSVSALRAAFRPFPFPTSTTLPAAALTEPTTIEEALMGRPVERLRRCEEDTVFRELKRADVDAVKELHVSRTEPDLIVAWDEVSVLGARRKS